MFKAVNTKNKSQDNVRIVEQYESVASIYPESAEDAVRASIEGYFDYFKNKEQPLKPHVIDEIIERMRLNLTEADFLDGLALYFNDQKISIADGEAFENFIIGCKILYDVQKHFFISTTATSFNQLSIETRKKLKDHNRMIRHEINDEDMEIKNKINLPEQNPLLSKLKVSKDNESSRNQRMLVVHGTANCGAQSRVGVRKFLHIQSNKLLIEAQLKNDDHSFLILYSDRKENVETGCYIDIWVARVYPLLQLEDKLRGHHRNANICWNYVYELDFDNLEMDMIYFNNLTASCNVKQLCTQATISLRILQRAAFEVSRRITQYEDDEECILEILNFLKKKQEHLKDFCEDIDFAIEQINKQSSRQLNYTLTDELNKQIENFYTTLYCKILRAPLGEHITLSNPQHTKTPVTKDTIAFKPYMHSRLFNNQHLPKIKMILSDYARKVDCILEESLGVNSTTPNRHQDFLIKENKDEPSSLFRRFF